jgi:uncharacterized Zn-binding protein involved in type VI secretion
MSKKREFIFKNDKGEEKKVEAMSLKRAIHVRFVNAGSSTVRVSGSFVARIGDSADSGQMITGSSNIFVG